MAQCKWVCESCAPLELYAGPEANNPLDVAVIKNSRYKQVVRDRLPDRTDTGDGHHKKEH